MFMLHPRPDRTLFQRVLRAVGDNRLILTLDKSYLERNQGALMQTPSKASTGKRGAKKVVEEIKEETKGLEVHFIDLTTSEEKE